MKYFPVFLKVSQQKIVVSGGDETAIAKLRLILKTEAKIEVYSNKFDEQILEWAHQSLLQANPRRIEACDIENATVVYAANEDDGENLRVYNLAKAAGVLINVVDKPSHCDFITPAIVDRDPVVVAIGTEGTAPVLARKIKKKIEEELSPSLGDFVRIGERFRRQIANFSSKKRRTFWAKYFDTHFENKEQATRYLENLANDAEFENNVGFVSFVGAGPGDPELLTLKARKRLHEADVILHDRLITKEILELARREALVIETGKKGFGPSWNQEDINEAMVKYANAGHHIVRLKGGDPVIYGRLDEETTVLQTNHIDFEVVPGVSAANSAAASLGVSLTKRERNSEFRFLTGRDVDGFAEHDWNSLAKKNQCAAIYMGAKQATQLRGRLLMHGADPSKAVTLVENASRKDERVIYSNLLNFPDDLTKAEARGPVVILFGIGERHGQRAGNSLLEAANETK